MNKQEGKLSHLQAESNEINKTNLVNTLKIMDDDFENQKRAYDNYLKLFYPKLLRTKTIYIDLFNILDRDLDLTKVSLGDYFLAQFINEVNKSLDRIENEVNKYVQHNNIDKTQKEHLLYHKSLLINCVNELMNKNSSSIVLKENKKSKTYIDENGIKFKVLLNFANGEIYALHNKGFSHPKKAEELFKNHPQTKSIIAYIKNTYTNFSKDKDIHNKNKNLFNNIELIAFVKNHCNEKGIDINPNFLKDCDKHAERIRYNN